MKPLFFIFAVLFITSCNVKPKTTVQATITPERKDFTFDEIKRFHTTHIKEGGMHYVLYEDGNGVIIVNLTKDSLETQVFKHFLEDADAGFYGPEQFEEVHPLD